MTDHHVIKRGDTPTLSWRANADLTGATLRWLMTTHPGADLTIEKTPTTEVQDDGSTIVSVTLTADDTATVGTYRCELEATKAGVVLTYPNAGYDELYIVADLG